jgi:hypothetical protein
LPIAFLFADLKIQKNGYTTPAGKLSRFRRISGFLIPIFISGGSLEALILLVLAISEYRQNETVSVQFGAFSK